SARLTELSIGPDSPAFASISAGQPYTGPMTLAGETYLVGMQPIVKMSGEAMGAIFVGQPASSVEASANSTLGLIAMVGLGVTAALGLIGFVASRLITRPLPRLAGAMEAIAEGRYDTEVPYTDLGN